MQLINFSRVILLCLSAQFTYASEDCSNLSLKSIFDTSDTVVEVTNLSASLNFQQFEEYMRNANEYSEIEIRRAFRDYVKEFENDIFRIKYMYKGGEQLDSEIYVLGNSGEFIPGKNYILFLDATPISSEGVKKTFLFNGCALVDMDNSHIVWDNVLIDVESYQPFMNQLMFMKQNGDAPVSIPDVRGKSLTSLRE